MLSVRVVINSQISHAVGIDEFSLGMESDAGLTTKRKNRNSAQDTIAFMGCTTTVLLAIDINNRTVSNGHVDSQGAFKQSGQVVRLGMPQCASIEDRQDSRTIAVLINERAKLRTSRMGDFGNAMTDFSSIAIIVAPSAAKLFVPLF